MERISKESLNRNTPLYIVVEYLKQNTDDKHPRCLLSEYHQGIKCGELKLLDMLEGLLGEDND